MWDSTFCKPICIMLIGFAILSNSTNKQSKTPRSPSFLVPNRTAARLYSMNCFIFGIGRLINGSHDTVTRGLHLCNCRSLIMDPPRQVGRPSRRCQVRLLKYGLLGWTMSSTTLRRLYHKYTQSPSEALGDLFCCPANLLQGLTTEEVDLSIT